MVRLTFHDKDGGWGTHEFLGGMSCNVLETLYELIQRKSYLIFFRFLQSLDLYLVFVFFSRFSPHFLSCVPTVVGRLFEKWRYIHKVSSSVAKIIRSYSSVCIKR